MTAAFDFSPYVLAALLADDTRYMIAFTMLVTISLLATGYHRQKRHAKKMRELTISAQYITDRFEQLSSKSRTYLWEVDLDGLHTYISPSITNLLGWEPEELIGKSNFYIMFPEDKITEMKNYGYDYIKSGKEMVDFENQQLTKDGELIWMVTNGMPVHDESGEIVGYEVVIVILMNKRKVKKDVYKQKSATDRLLPSLIPEPGSTKKNLIFYGVVQSFSRC